MAVRDLAAGVEVPWNKTAALSLALLFCWKFPGCPSTNGSFHC